MTGQTLTDVVRMDRCECYNSYVEVVKMYKPVVLLVTRIHILGGSFLSQEGASRLRKFLLDEYHDHKGHRLRLKRF